MASRDGLERSPLPADLQSLAQFLVGHVQISLRLLHARVSQHQLDDAEVDAVRQQPAGALVALMPRAA